MNFFRIVTGIWIVFILLFSMTESVKAQIVINEVLSNPVGDDAGAEWVELYNKNNEPVSLSGCTLFLHESDNFQKVVFDTDAFVDKFKVITWSDSWLNNSGDTIRLVCSSMNDTVSYGNQAGAVVSSPNEGYTFGCSPDGAGSYYVLSSVTLGEPNTPPPSPTPTPTNIPTNTPAPTNTTAPSNTPVPNTPTPTLRPTATLTPRPTLKPTTPPKDYTDENKKLREGADVSQFRYESDPKDTDTGVLGAESDVGEEGNNNGKVSPIAFVLLGLGAVSIGTSAFFFIKNRKQSV